MQKQDMIIFCVSMGRIMVQVDFLNQFDRNKKKHDERLQGVFTKQKIRSFVYKQI